MQHILLNLASNKDMAGRRVLVTAGPTCEDIDPVRYITNRSSGKMGYAVAKMAVMRGAEVTLVSGPVGVEPFTNISVVPVRSAAEMFRAVTAVAPEHDIIVMCSAVADYTPVSCADHKLKKSDADLSIPLVRTKDILKHLGEHKRVGQTLVGFSMETDNLIENSRQKLLKKGADIICANSLNGSLTGFAADTNMVTLITRHGERELPLCSKEETADMILSFILEYGAKA